MGEELKKRRIWLVRLPKRALRVFDEPDGVRRFRGECVTYPPGGSRREGLILCGRNFFEREFQGRTMPDGFTFPAALTDELLEKEDESNGEF